MRNVKKKRKSSTFLANYIRIIEKLRSRKIKCYANILKGISKKTNYFPKVCIHSKKYLSSVKFFISVPPFTLMRIIFSF